MRRRRITTAPPRNAASKLDIPFEVRVVSAHRTPDQLFVYADSAERRGLEVVIAAAGGALRRQRRHDSLHRHAKRDVAI